MGASGKHRHTNSVIELRWTTTTHTIFLDGLDSALFDSFIPSKASKVVASKIKHLLASCREISTITVNRMDSLQRKVYGAVWNRVKWGQKPVRTQGFVCSKVERKE